MYNFRCSLKKESKDINYVYLQLFDIEYPSGLKDAKGVSFWRQSLDKMREFDLVLISNEEIDVERNSGWCNSDFLAGLKIQKGKFLAMVRMPRKSDHNFIKIKVDIGLDDFFFENQGFLNDSKNRIFCYSVGSLLTAVREFKTIKNCEFFNTGPIIFNPKQGLDELHCEEAKNVQPD